MTTKPHRLQQLRLKRPKRYPLRMRKNEFSICSKTNALAGQTAAPQSGPALSSTD
jgi:hypothetical protein